MVISKRKIMWVPAESRHLPVNRQEATQRNVSSEARMRHSAATYLRNRFGIEAARVVLGHRSSAVTEVYAELDRTKAADIMAEVG